MNKSEGFYGLPPHDVLNAIDSYGLVTTGEYLQLNSYENRVFDAYLEAEQTPKELKDRIIAKFYRPNRWSESAIEDEHRFTQEDKSEGKPAITTFNHNGQTVSEYNNMYFILSNKKVLEKYSKGLNNISALFYGEQPQMKTILSNLKPWLPKL